MSIETGNHRTYTFGEFTLDVDRGALLGVDGEIKLRPKSFEVLSYLLERHGCLVSKDELLNAIWGHKAVTEDSITQCLIEVRRAIQDRSQIMIKTVPKRGLIFDLPVTENSNPIGASGTSSGSTVAPPSWFRWPLAAAVFLAIGAAAVWWKIGIDSADTPVTTPTEAEATSPSIAILPFVDMSAAQDQEYFTDGIAEELINLLTQIPELRVIARTSSFSFKGQNLDIAEIAKRLNVTHVLEGSVRTSDGRLRITAQLVDARTSEHLWSKNYDRTLEDIFVLQDEISAAVVEQLATKMLDPIPTVRETDPEAYRLFLQALHLASSTDMSKSGQAEALFRQALQVDPDFTSARRELGRILWRRTSIAPNVREHIRQVREAQEIVQKLAPDDAASLAYSAWHVQDFDGDIAEATRMMERAISMEPANEHVLRAALLFGRAFGSVDDAIAIGEFSAARNPLCELCNFHLARAYRDAGQLDKAVAQVKENQSLFGGFESELGLILLLQGNPQAALGLMKMELWEPARHIGTTMALHDLGRHGEADAALAELKEVVASSPSTAYEHEHWKIARVYAWMGEADAAFAAMEQAAELTRIRVDGELVRRNPLGLALQTRNPFYHRLHDDPRWQRFWDKYGVSSEHIAKAQFKPTLPE